MAKLIVARGSMPARRLLEARRSPARVQAETLNRILARNADCAFGKAHGLSRQMTAAEYKRAVPICDYEALRPYVERMLQGEARVLCRDAPFMFGTTSGTTSQRKYIPINSSWVRSLSNAMRLWLARSTLAHPKLWHGKVLTLVGSTSESVVPCGLPAGAVSGLTSARVSRVVKKRYVLPALVSEISDHDTRYAVGARLMLECDVSLAAAPNSTTLLRLAEVSDLQSESIIGGVFTGKLGVAANNDADSQLLAELEKAHCRPNKDRARRLEEVRRETGSLKPRDAWSNLALIGCWLGGTAGVFAERLEAYYGAVPLRDLGLRATEATMTIALEDGNPAGVPLLHDNYYEFVHESETRGQDAPTLGITELEVGQRYYILMTTQAGLYRYDISDVVEVTGKYHELPLLAFAHKGPDMLNLTGEKVHSDQVAKAVMLASNTLGAQVRNAQVIPDLAHSRYELLLETPYPELSALAHAIDVELAALNPEYASKRASSRLAPLHPVRMKPGWGLRLMAADVAKGLRESQYKWPFVRHQWDDVSRTDVDP